MKLAAVVVSGRLDGKDVEKPCASAGAGVSVAQTYASRVRRARSKDESDEQTFYVRDGVSGDALFHVIVAPDGVIYTRDLNGKGTR